MNYKDETSKLSNKLRLGESFDIIMRELYIGEKKTAFYYIDGFIKDDVMQMIMTGFLTIRKEELSLCKDALDFIHRHIPYVEVAIEDDLQKISTAVLCGQTAMYLEGFKSWIILDLRTYPVRGPQEPEKEKVLRGARDGFVETIVFNTALVRRRVRDENLTYEMLNVGRSSRTDVTIGYIKGKVNEKELDHVRRKIKEINVNALTVGDQSLVDALGKSSWLNPFPKVRYTERPDVAAAHILEGKILIFVDNSPTAIILPTSVFDFMQDIDDYYFPGITGTYLRVVRNAIMLFTIFITPLYLIIAKGAITLPPSMQFLLPSDTYAVPLVIQFILLEFAIDGLKLASLNTPNSLGMSLSVIGGLILGEFAIKTGWFIPESILYMSISALASFAQPSIELSYAFKFFRIITLMLASKHGLIGFAIGIASLLLSLLFTKTLTGGSYLYPLIPFNWKALRNLLFRTKQDKSNN